MNKKAIAAFAAGATLLAGFAMATPAFAGARKDAMQKAEAVYNAEHDVRDARKALEKDKLALIEANSNAALLAAKAKSAKAKADAAQTKLDDAKKALEAATVAYADKKLKADTGKTKNFDEWKAEYAKDNDAAVKAEYEKLNKAVTDAQTKVDDAKHSYTVGKNTVNSLTLAGVAEGLQALADAAAESVSALKEQVTYDESNLKTAIEYLNALNGVTPDSTKPDQTKPDQTKPDQTKPDQTTPDHTKPVQTADPTKSAASAELMRTQVVLAEADATNKDAQEKFVKSKAGFEAAKTQMAAFDAQVKSAADREEALRVAGKTDTDAYKAAVIDLKAAQSRANAYRTHEYANAEKDFGEKSGKALLAAAAYNAALVNYRAAYNKAVEVEASAVKGFADPNTLNPVSTDFPAAPAAAKAEAKKVEAKAEAKAQAAAPAAVAGKAGAAAAKGELAGMGTKGGNGHGGKAGEQLGNAGVGVALTALAASMLAGMGAAVRKMRH